MAMRRSNSKPRPTADTMAKKAQLKRGAAAMRKGAEGPKRSMPSGRVRYMIKEGPGEASFVTRKKGAKPPKGAKKVAARKPVRYGKTSPQAYGAANSRKKTVRKKK